MKTKKHILFLTPGFPENEADTTCIPAMQVFFKQLQDTQLIEISVISFQYPYQKDTYSWYGIKVYSTGGKNRKGLKRYLNWQKVFKLAGEINKNKPISQLHSFWFSECAYVGNRIAKKIEIPHSCTFMGQDALKENYYLKKIKKLPQVITLSKFHAATLKESSGIVSDFVIPWGIEDMEQLPAVKKEVDILGVGNLIPLKAFDRLIHVVKNVQLKIPDVKAEIIGDGHELEYLQRLIEENGLSENILVKGKLDRSAVLNRMGQSKCLLHLSQYESFGMVLIEAHSLGVKVFSTNVGIAGEIEDISIINGDKDASQQILDFLKDNEFVSPPHNYSIKTTVDSYVENVFLM